MGALPGSPRSESPIEAAPSARADALSLEMEHLSRLRALQSSDPAQAVVAADEGDRIFPRGLFRQERESIAIEALVRLGKTSEARTRAQAFKAAYPQSPFLGRMTGLTGESRQ